MQQQKHGTVLLGQKLSDLNEGRRAFLVVMLVTISLGGNIAFARKFTVKTELWNGSSWTEVNNLSTAEHVLLRNSGSTT